MMKYFFKRFKRYPKSGVTLEQNSSITNYDKTLVDALMDNISDHIYFKDRNSRFIRINKALARYFNLDDPSLANNKTDFDFFTEEHARQAFDDEQTIIRTGRPVSREEKETWEGKPDSWVSTVKMPWFGEKGDIIGTFGISRDITRLVRAESDLKEKNEEIRAQNEEYLQVNEELRQTNEELAEARARAEESDKLKTAILQNMNHEIRTPLNAILGFTELFPSFWGNREMFDKHSRIIAQSGQELLETVSNLLDIARIASGQMAVYPAECRIDEMFGEIGQYFNEYRQRTGKQHIELVLPDSLGLPCETFITDGARLKQIILNLTCNAFKFTESGAITIRCRQHQGRELIFSVSDTGIGIRSEKQAYIFEQFTQVENGNTRKYRGAGIGLAIAKGLVDLLGGKIWLESEPGKGSTFYFSVPDKTI
jgi:PAS domain S-box-containing protein